MRFFLLVVLLTATAAFAAPSTFVPVVGNALLCNDHIDPVFFRDYLSTYFKPPYKTEGGAYWFKPEGARLFGSEVEDIFVSDESVAVDFLGVVINERLPAVRQQILDTKGVVFSPDTGETSLRSPAGSFLIDYGGSKTKLFCVKYRVSRHR
ncbi:MAG: hypothetical protein K8F27_05520 [Sulfuricellaceae bacterium]|nr:hypothetical protein [Sulfuricellaceae bacterium]